MGGVLCGVGFSTPNKVAGYITQDMCSDTRTIFDGVAVATAGKSDAAAGHIDK